MEFLSELSDLNFKKHDGNFDTVEYVGDLRLSSTHYLSKGEKIHSDYICGQEVMKIDYMGSLIIVRDESGNQFLIDALSNKNKKIKDYASDVMKIGMVEKFLEPYRGGSREFKMKLNMLHPEMDFIALNSRLNNIGNVAYSEESNGGRSLIDLRRKVALKKLAMSFTPYVYWLFMPIYNSPC